MCYAADAANNLGLGLDTSTEAQLLVGMYPIIKCCMELGCLDFSQALVPSPVPHTKSQRSPNPKVKLGQGVTLKLEECGLQGDRK